MAAETLLTIAADPKHLGARIGATLVLHTWGSALTHHPHVHGIVPGGGLAPDGKQLGGLQAGILPARCACCRGCSGGASSKNCNGCIKQASCSSSASMWRWPRPRPSRPGSRRCATYEWVVYAKRPFAGPQAVLAYLSRYTHRVAISNSRLIALDERGVTFRWKDYRAKGHTRYKAMTLDPGEFMRRFLLHVLPGGFHRIRHYGLLANGSRTASLALARELLYEPTPAKHDSKQIGIKQPTFVCTHCGGAMIILQTFMRGQPIRAPPLERA